MSNQETNVTQAEPTEPSQVYVATAPSDLPDMFKGIQETLATTEIPNRGYQFTDTLAEAPFLARKAPESYVVMGYDVDSDKAVYNGRWTDFQLVPNTLVDPEAYTRAVTAGEVKAHTLDDELALIKQVQDALGFVPGDDFAIAEVSTEPDFDGQPVLQASNSTYRHFTDFLADFGVSAVLTLGEDDKLILIDLIKRTQEYELWSQARVTAIAAQFDMRTLEYQILEEGISELSLGTYWIQDIEGKILVGIIE